MSSLLPTSVTRTPYTAAQYAAAGRALTRREVFDQCDGPGTKAIYDWASLRGRPGGKDGAVDPALGTACLPLTPYGGAATIKNGEIGYAGGGLDFGTQDNPGRMSMWVDCGPITPEIGDVVTFWMKGAFVYNNFNNRLVELGTALVTSPSANDQGVCTTYEVFSPNAQSTVVDSAALRAAMADGKVHQIGHAIMGTGGGKYCIVSFLDGQRIYVGPEYAFGAPAAGLLTIGGHSANSTPVCRQYRLYVRNAVAAGMNVDQIVALDWAANKSRLLTL